MRLSGVKIIVIVKDMRARTIEQCIENGLIFRTPANWFELIKSGRELIKNNYGS